jgi:hypothetical protein
MEQSVPLAARETIAPQPRRSATQR